MSGRLVSWWLVVRSATVGRTDGRRSAAKAQKTENRKQENNQSVSQYEGSRVSQSSVTVTAGVFPRCTPTPNSQLPTPNSQLPTPNSQDESSQASIDTVTAGLQPAQPSVSYFVCVCVCASVCVCVGVHHCELSLVGGMHRDISRRRLAPHSTAQGRTSFTARALPGDLMGVYVEAVFVVRGSHVQCGEA